MTWCTKCKNEYREGFTVCADCGVSLVDEEPVQEDDLSGYEGEPGLSYDEIPEESENDESSLPDENKTKGGLRGRGYYQDSLTMADENRSSGWMLTVIGVVGLVLVVLGVSGVLPIKMGNAYLFYGVMGAIFLLFLVAGAVSLRNAVVFEGKAESENTLRSTMLDWCRETLNAADIDAAAGGEGIPDEILYLNRTECIKEKLNRQFLNLDQDFLDRFVEDQVYGMLYEDTKT